MRSLRMGNLRMWEGNVEQRLRRHWPAVEAIAEALLERGTLDDPEEIARIINSKEEETNA